jgi:hypothetical protein
MELTHEDHYRAITLACARTDLMHAGRQGRAPVRIREIMPFSAFFNIIICYQ